MTNQENNEQINKERREKLFTAGKALAAIAAMVALPAITSLAEKTAEKKETPTYAVWG